MMDIKSSVASNILLILSNVMHKTCIEDTATSTTDYYLFLIAVNLVGFFLYSKQPVTNQLPPGTREK